MSASAGDSILTGIAGNLFYFLYSCINLPAIVKLTYKSIKELIMNFSELVQNRQSCRNYDSTKPVEEDKINAILASARLAPSACNSQPYLITVCTGENAKKVAKATTGMGMNKFTANAPVMLVISEGSYNKTAAFGSKLKSNDYRSIDIGILTAYITAQATELGLGTCILGWLDDSKIKEICNLKEKVRLVISLGYPHPDDKLRTKVRKPIDEIVTRM